MSAPIPPRCASVLSFDGKCIAGEHDEWVNAILEQTPDDWDGDEAGESIAVAYVRHLEAVVRHAYGEDALSRWFEVAPEVGVSWRGTCRHCGDRTESGDDPAPGMCAMCSKAGRS